MAELTETGCLCLHPAVCAVEDDYEIIFLCREKALASVTVAGVTYTDSRCGVMRTDTLVHKVRVPAAALNAARHYDVNVAPLKDHCNYYPKPEPTEVFGYDFRPVPDDPDTPVRMYVLADTHGCVDAPVQAALSCGGMDALILDGDIGDSADTVDMITTMHRLASAITKGSFPVIYARGNHDTRGHNAEHLLDFVPVRKGEDNGVTAFTFRLGPVWGLVLDAGEDKADDRIEYGGVCDFPVFRRAQTAYFKSLIAGKAHEYEADGVKYRIAVCHMPFHYSQHGFAQTTPDIYAEWVHLLNEMGVQVLLCGHMHHMDELDGSIFAGEEKPAFPTLLCAAMDGEPKRRAERWIPGTYTGTLVTCAGGEVLHEFTNHRGEAVTL